MKRMLECRCSDLVSMTRDELLYAMAASEGRTLACETVGTLQPMLGDITNAEFVAAMGADLILLNIFEIAKYKAVVVYSNPPILPWIASWAKVLFGTKLIFVSYDLYPEVATVTNTLRDGNMICRLMNHINKCVYRRADHVVSLGSEQRAYILNHREITEDKVTVIPNWYKDEGELSRNREDNRFRETVGDRFVVSYFGNMGTMQDMKTILGAIRELKDDDKVFFLFAGHGNKMEKLKKIVEDEGIGNIAIHSFLHGQDFRDALAISDCAFVSLEKGATGLCVPSKTYSYMMQGIPLLAVMDEGDIVSDIKAGAGKWVRNDEAEALEGLATLIDTGFTE